MGDLFGHDERFERALKELRREKATRVRVYSHWVSSGRMNPDLADHQMAGLNDAIALIEEFEKEKAHG